MARGISMRKPDAFPGSQTHSVIRNHNALCDDVDTLAGPLMALLRGSATYDPASLTTGSGASTTVTVTGAALGDFVVVSFSLDLQGILLTGYVSAANTVTARFQNQTGGTLDLASGTLRALVFPMASFVAGITAQTANKVGDAAGIAV